MELCISLWMVRGREGGRREREREQHKSLGRIGGRENNGFKAPRDSVY